VENGDYVTYVVIAPLALPMISAATIVVGDSKNPENPLAHQTVPLEALGGTFVPVYGGAEATALPAGATLSLSGHQHGTRFELRPLAMDDLRWERESDERWVASLYDLLPATRVDLVTTTAAARRNGKAPAGLPRQRLHAVRVVVGGT
jgi:hypothetical protein